MGEIVRRENVLEVLFIAVDDEFFALFLIARPHFALHLAAETFDPRRRQHSFGRTADAHVKIDIGFGKGGRHCRGDVSIADHPQRRTARANLFDDFLVARAVEHHHDHVLDAFVHRARHDRECFSNGCVEVERVAALLSVLNHARSIGQLRHVERGHIAERDFHAFLRTRGRNATDRVWRAFGNIRRSVDRIDRDIELGCAREPGAELLAFKNSGGVVFDSFADHHFTADVHQIEHAAHGIARRCVGGFLVAAPEPAQRIEGGRFGRAHEIELNDPLDVVIIYFRQPMHDGRSFSRRSCEMTTA